MYKKKDIDLSNICQWTILKEKSIKLRPSRLEQVVLPSVFHTEEYNILKER